MAAAWSADDLLLAIERHATSKLPERDGEDDLSHIETLGFRGEALPSIGAVARLSIASRTAAGEAHEIHVDGGAVSGPGPAAFRGPGQHGTRVEVRELFYATPGAVEIPQIRALRRPRHHRMSSSGWRWRGPMLLSR